MNYWLQRRKRSIDFSLEVTRSSIGKVVLNEFYLDTVKFDPGGKHLVIKCDYNSNIETIIKIMMVPGLISDHLGELRVYKSGTLRELWIIPNMQYLNFHKPRMSHKMFFSVTSSLIHTIKSDFLS